MLIFHKYKQNNRIPAFALLLFFSLAGLYNPCLAEEPDSLLTVIIPSRDTTTVTLSRHRIAANTKPDFRAFINGDEVRVHPNGAFVGLVNLPVGESSVEIKVKSPKDSVITRTFFFVRSGPLQTSPSEPLVLEKARMLPNQTIEADVGTIIDIRIKGSPGKKAFFSIDGIIEKEPMHELPASQTGGIRGIYAGRYIVQPGDEAKNIHVRYLLKDGKGNHVEKENPYPLSITPKAFPRVAEIIARRAHLNTGTGTDRLGGARLGFLQRGVRLEVIGREGPHYLVRLSEGLTGYVPVRFTRLLPEGTPLPRVLTGSIHLAGHRDRDVVTLGLPQRLPYIVTMRNDPAVVEIDLFGASSNTNWMTDRKQAAGIRLVEWEQVATRHFRLRIHLEHDAHWGVHVGYGTGTSLRIQVNRPPLLASPERPLEGMKIALDVGHGGTNRGALGPSGSKEKDIVLDVSLKMRALLEEEGASVIMTRDRDVNVSILGRAEMVLATDAHALVSIHANSIGYASDPDLIHGTSSYYRYEAWRPLTSKVHDRMLELPLIDFGLIGSFNFSLNALTELPNVLVETGFISHPEEEMKLLDPEFQQAMAKKMVEGLRDYFIAYGMIKK